MAGEKSLLLSIIGDWTDSALSEESWQVGIRLALVFGSVDPVGTFPSNWDPTGVTINRTETDWTITGNWHATTGLGGVFSPDDYLNDQAAPAVAAWMLRTALSEKCRVRSLKLSPIGAPTGHLVPAVPYSVGTPCTLTWTGAYPVGTNGADILPLQNAVVASHRTAQPGRQGRGRAFLPGPTTSMLGSDGHLSTVRQTDWLNAQVALLEGLAYSAGGAIDPHVRPVVTGGNWTKYGVISQVRVGNVMDTQRRRRRALTETYVVDSPSY
jgi:hypothetical protein